MNKSIIFIFLFLLMTPLAFAASDNLTLDLDVSDFVLSNRSITLLDNQSLFIELNAVDSRFNVEFPSSIYFDDVDTLDVIFNFSSNYTFLVNETVPFLFFLTNDFNNNTINYTVFLTVLPKDNVIFSGDVFLELLDGDYYLNISETLIPKSGQLNYSIKGVESTELFIYCSSDWLSCPSSVFFNSNNESSFNINYSLPFNTVVGIYELPIIFNTSNISLESKLVIQVTEADIFFENYDLTDDCIKEFNNTKYVDFDCYINYEQYNVRRLSNIYEILKNKTALCSSNIVTEYTMVGSIDEDVMRLYDVCVSDRDGFKADKQEVESELAICQSEFNTVSNDFNEVKNRLLDNESATLTQAFNYKTQTLSDCAFLINQSKEDAKIKARKVTFWNVSFWILVLLVLFFVSLIKAQKSEVKFKW